MLASPYGCAAEIMYLQIAATEEEKEAGLVLTELFTLGVEDDVVSDSEDDHSDRALAASTTATEAQGPRIEEQGKDSHEQEAQARSSGSHA